MKMLNPPQSDPIIQENEKFYGYLKAIGFYNCSKHKGIWGGMYAIFEYQNKTTRWKVPDIKLFNLLARHLQHECEQLVQSDCFYTKLWIGKQEGKWWADLP